MAHRIAVSTLNASTIDILNTIRDNASLAYQNLVPSITQETDIPKVGEVLYGTPAMANEFINALVNRIAAVRVQSATFNNPYARLKKGMIDYGETIEDIFVGITKAFTFSQEKAESRELKQYKPNVKSAFHAMNWQVIYPVSVSMEQLKQAFLNAEGVTNLISYIVDAIYTAANYDEFLLFKYLIIKGVTRGQLKPVGVNNADIKNYAKAFRGKSNVLPFMSNEYNAAGVKNTTPKERQVIFMDAQFNADFDVDVLAGAFNMDKADFMGSLFLIDSFTTFDNDRFDVIRSESDGIEEVTDAELSLMANVKAILADENWFQVYDNLNQFTEKFISSGLRWNYFYHIWKTISTSPFANAIVFVDSSATISNPSTLTYKIATIDKNNNAVVVALEQSEDSTLRDLNAQFVQTEALTRLGYAIQPYGALFVPMPLADGGDSIYLEAALGDDTYKGQLTLNSAAGVYTVTLTGTWANGDKITVDGTEVTLDATSAASVTAAATAVVSALSGNSHYTASNSAGVITLTEKSGQYGYGAPTVSKTSTNGKTAVATTTLGGVTNNVGDTVTLTKQ